MKIWPYCILQSKLDSPEQNPSPVSGGSETNFDGESYILCKVQEGSGSIEQNYGSSFV